jgi:hypothetical protein
MAAATAPPAADVAPELRRRLADLKRHVSHNQLAIYRPYPKQAEFYVLGASHRECLLAAGNQVGKTLCAAMEVAAHTTGSYPEWWRGRRFTKPIVAWCAGVTGEQTRDAVQRRLLGRSGSAPVRCRKLGLRIGRPREASLASLIRFWFDTSAAASRRSPSRRTPGAGSRGRVRVATLYGSMKSHRSTSTSKA